MTWCRGASAVSNAKGFELAGVGQPLLFDLSHERAARASVTPGREPLQAIARALGDHFDIPVLGIAYPAGQTQSASFLDGREAETDSLDATLDAEVKTS